MNITRNLFHSAAPGGLRANGMLALAVLGLTIATSTQAAESAACKVLSTETVASVQGYAVVETVPSEQQGTSIFMDQCIYRTEDMVSSVSVTLTAPRSGSGDDARNYWTKYFHPEGGHSGKDLPPEQINGLGDEGFWVTDKISGSLYVLTGERFLRISVGGVRDLKERRKRSITLAHSALASLNDV